VRRVRSGSEANYQPYGANLTLSTDWTPDHRDCFASLAMTPRMPVIASFPPAGAADPPWMKPATRALSRRRPGPTDPACCALEGWAPAFERVIQLTDCAQCRENWRVLANASGTACEQVIAEQLSSCTTEPEIRVIKPNYPTIFDVVNWITSSFAGAAFYPIAPVEPSCFLLAPHRRSRPTGYETGGSLG